MTAWRTLQASVRGAAHRRSGLPNQDAVRIVRAPGGQALILALADGHGSARCFRSQVGAKLAVASARRLARRLHEPASLTQIKRWAEEQLPVELVRSWRERVEQSLARYPITEAELAALDLAGRRALDANPWLAYGTTLLTVAIAPTFVFFLQLGDGDILTVSDEGQVDRPLPPDERLIGNETTSLCSHQAWKEARVTFQTLAGVPPALILAATDGYANSFRDEGGFRQVARDLWAMIRDEGLDPVQSQLKGWLSEASEFGSGDDITVALACRRDIDRAIDAAAIRDPGAAEGAESE
ncbi:PP2C family serine/threonine-protein phosphatase [Thioalkalicoccus limnaeus]|uniref:PP2C family serine/threonine-protein phosphatase n=1 Tax=Thioalkalicoccus limnaeus TaxID=120681 RepID=A0ABV4BIQ7_9GAMM